MNASVRWLAAAVSVALVLCLFAPNWVLAQGTSLKLYSKKSTYDDARFELENAIIKRGLIIDLNGQVSKMLERTGADVGSTKPIYKRAEYFVFCSAKLSRAAMEADPINLGVCPYVIFIYETATAPGKVQMGYRRPHLQGSAKSRTALRAVERLLGDIVRDAMK
jgi:uncharacterized protein (DUF302 family)